jgi:MFS transporter, ACS family, tartrate transporter
VFGASCSFLLIVAARQHFTLVVLLFTLGSAFYFASIPCIWAMASMMLSGTTAAVALGMITSISQIGAFAGPYLVGYFRDESKSILPGIALIGCSYLIAALVFSLPALAVPVKAKARTNIPAAGLIDSAAQ